MTNRIIKRSRPSSALQSSLTDIDTIHRSAFNTSTVLGSLYNARKDSVSQNILLSRDMIIKPTTYKPVKCMIMTDDMFEVDYLFRDIGITNESWLSLILDIVPAEGINALIHYSFTKSTNNRYLYYHYKSEENIISPDQNLVRRTIPKDIPTTIATHVVSRIELGIVTFIVLQLPPNDQTNLDSLLEKIKDQLIKNKIELSKDEKVLLSTITVTNVFSNTPSLINLSNLLNICRTITQIKPIVCRHLPMECTLRPIKWFYPSYSTEKSKYIPIESDTLKIIKQYLLPLSAKINYINTLLDSQVKHTLEQYLNRQYDNIQQQILNVQEIYSKEINQIRDLVIQSRREKNQEKMIVDMLKYKSSELLQNNLDHCIQHVHCIVEKVQFINQLNKQNIRYMNVEQSSILQNNDLSGILSKLLDKNKSHLVFCCTDDLKHQNSRTWNNYYNNWIKIHGTNSAIFPVYADFTDKTYHLSEMKIFRLESSTYSREQTESIRLPTSSIEEPIPADNKPPDKQIQESIRPSRSPNLLNRKTTSSQEKQPLKENNQTKSFIQSPSKALLTLADKNKQVEDSSNLDNTQEPTDLSRSLTSSLLHPPPRKKRSPTMIEQSMALPPTVTPRATLSASNSKRSVLSTVPLTSSSTGSILLSKKHLQNAEQDSDSPNLSVSPRPTTAPRTRKEIKDANEKSKQLNSLTHSIDTCDPLVTEQLSQGKEHTDLSRPSTASPAESEARRRRRRDLSHMSNITYKNVVLLGQSGVGKSTFINALLNYLTFKTLHEAHSSQPLVAIPVSFLITVGDHFEEKIVTFGDQDPNEDHHHPGQSVTQHCRSYVFHIDSQTKLRIIDTPGMGDTRGLEQDDLNMQHILSFINNLSHINAICILLKPNESRLNIIVRSYLTRLLTFLGENARHNLVFCFTNTRSTFYGPGNSGPLVKEMLKTLPIKDIRFEKSNSFCFDSESFRYLIGLQNGIEFDEYQEREYKQSWRMSAKESNRLVKYICGELKGYGENEWQSVEHVHFKMNELIRPMLESTRNIIRNITLLKEQSSNHLIKLYPTALSRSAVICRRCKRIPTRFTHFWILLDDLHTVSDKCNICDCNLKKHRIVDYKLDYEVIHYSGRPSFKKMNSNFEQLKSTLLEFAQFYISVDDNMKKNDPMLSTMRRMVDEETEICSQTDPTGFNSILRDSLISLIETYKERQTVSRSIKIPTDLSNVYEHIRHISSMDEIREQLYAIKQTQEIYMKQHEKHV